MGGASVCEPRRVFAEAKPDLRRRGIGVAGAPVADAARGVVGLGRGPLVHPMTPATAGEAGPSRRCQRRRRLIRQLCRVGASSAYFGSCATVPDRRWCAIGHSFGTTAERLRRWSCDVRDGVGLSSPPNRTARSNSADRPLSSTPASISNCRPAAAFASATPSPATAPARAAARLSQTDRSISATVNEDAQFLSSREASFYGFSAGHRGALRDAGRSAPHP